VTPAVVQLIELLAREIAGELLRPDENPERAQVERLGSKHDESISRNLERQPANLE